MSVLKKVEKRLKHFFTFFKSSDIIVVSMDKSELPFAHIIEEKDALLVSFAVGFPMPDVAASIVLEMCDLKEVILIEKFHVSNTGETFWGDEAMDRFNIDTFVDLESLEAVSEELN